MYVLEADVMIRESSSVDCLSTPVRNGVIQLLLGEVNKCSGGPVVSVLNNCVYCMDVYVLCRGANGFRMSTMCCFPKLLCCL